jgi:hypothetical protein
MAQTWKSNTVPSPSGGDVIIDTGPIGAAGTYTVQTILNATLAADCLLQLRNAANDANINEQELSILANNATPVGPQNIFVDTNQRLRIVMKSGTLGRVSGSILYG